jgi:GNAT superfamily N-acetyltransferase
MTEDDASFGFSAFSGSQAIGFSSWEPGQFPVAIVGHNCILPDYQGNDFGRMQMMETINRLRTAGFKKAKVTTGEPTFFIPAQKMYTFCGFKEFERRYEDKNSDFRTIHYEMPLV